jgi:hypothetical protein
MKEEDTCEEEDTCTCEKEDVTFKEGRFKEGRGPRSAYLLCFLHGTGWWGGGRRERGAN